MKFALIDAANLFNRAHHVCGGDAYTKSGMALHIIFNALGKVFREQNADHIVLCAEGRSWRYDYYPQYKAKRKLMRESQSPKEAEEQEVFFQVLKDFIEFMASDTRVTVLQTQGAEADDLIARFIDLHPNDEHVILSGDSDMIQLVADNVSIYNGVTNYLITKNGIFDEKGREMVFMVKPENGKIKIGETIEQAAKTKKQAGQKELRAARDAELLAEKAFKDAKKVYDKAEKGTVDAVAAKTAMEKAETGLTKARLNVLKAKNKAEEVFEFRVEPNWQERALFIKCIRGDGGDGVFSAYPGVRYLGSAKKVGIEDAWLDRHNKGFHWNNFMLQRWDKLNEDGTTEDVRVLDEYERNCTLIDLRAQPADIKDLLDRVIVEAIQKEPVGNVGIHFLRFCKRHDLHRLAERAQEHTKYLTAGYFK